MKQNSLKKYTKREVLYLLKQNNENAGVRSDN
jgi:hypothetical protein